MTYSESFRTTRRNIGMTTEKAAIPDPTVLKERVSKEKETDVEDALVSPERNLDDYVKIMVNLRSGTRPILCW